MKDVLRLYRSYLRVARSAPAPLRDKLCFNVREAFAAEREREPSADDAQRVRRADEALHALRIVLRHSETRAFLRDPFHAQQLAKAADDERSRAAGR